MKNIKNIKLKVIIGLIAVAFILVANLHYAFLEYGILSANTLHVNVLAQGSGSTGSGSSGNSGNSANSGDSGISGNFCPDFNYVPNRFITSTPTSTVKVRSNSNGELVIKGVVTGGYQRNREYSIITETRNCDGKQDYSCCDQRQVGTFVVVQ